MMTIVASITVKPGAEPEWDATMRERFDAASQQPGWLGGQLCTPVDGSDQRVIIGTWRSRDDWETWHHDEAFRQTRARLDELQAGPADYRWHEVIVSGQPG
jgi:heme-degrading monooxygenase HmoA